MRYEAESQASAKINDLTHFLTKATVFIFKAAHKASIVDPCMCTIPGDVCHAKKRQWNANNLRSVDRENNALMTDANARVIID